MALKQVVLFSPYCQCCFGYEPSSAFEPPHDKTNKMAVRPVKTQISLDIRSVWSEFSLCAQWVAKDPVFLHADSEDSDQTEQMSRLIWVFAGRRCHFVGLSWGGSFHNSRSNLIQWRICVDTLTDLEKLYASRTIMYI